MLKKLAVMMILVLGVFATACGDDDGPDGPDSSRPDASRTDGGR